MLLMCDSLRGGERGKKERKKELEVQINDPPRLSEVAVFFCCMNAPVAACSDSTAWQFT